jgi:hypothetical protein
MLSETRKTKEGRTIMKVGGEKIFGVWEGEGGVQVYALGPQGSLLGWISDRYCDFNVGLKYTSVR